MGPSFSRDSFPLAPTLLSFLLATKSFFTLPAAARPVVAAARRGLAIMERKSSLPPSIQPYIWTRPQAPQGSSSTSSSPGAQDEAAPELPSPALAPPRQTALPALLPSTFPDTRRQYSGYETGAHDPVSSHAPAGLPTPAGSSIPHGSAGRYRSPVVSDPNFPGAVRSQGASPYPGSQSLPALSQITGAAGHWREGEAGPSSLVHSQPSYVGSRRQSPNFPPPQQIYRRATEPGGYSTGEGPHVQLGFHGSYDRLRELPPPEGYLPSFNEPPRHPSAFARTPEGLYGALGGTRPGEQVELPPLFSAIQLQSSSSSLRVDDGENSHTKRKVPSDFDQNPQPTIIPKKILVACDFCRGRKLRCDGGTPKCANCLTRGMMCKYRPEPKRRGPGKAAKGSRGKKRVPKTGRHSLPARGADEDFDMQTIAPELRSRASFPESYSSSSQVAGRYDSRQPSPEWTPQQRRRPRSRDRAPSSEYYSTPSDTESKR
ncbi:hypothetical protein MVEN_00388300 [Mycena venus]|uniref:Zn(2)-C6 fungal-type domain-containing protein n=1 Tax=Mycena venus TaxID=2733690 RepID=A0A8H6YRY4_9AGAR|nr:hypothetical protein MVEN_00388300 [Mycena venus]